MKLQKTFIEIATAMVTVITTEAQLQIELRTQNQFDSAVTIQLTE